jgi:UrcA family protein
MNATRLRRPGGASRKWTLAALATLGFALAAPFANASQSIPVRVSDVDHSQLQGATVLYERLNAAARRVCEQELGNSGVRFYTMRECRERTVAEAIDEMDCNTMRGIHRARHAMNSLR